MASYVDKDGNKVTKVKKPFFKRIWVWIIAIIVVIAIFGSTDDGDTKTADADSGDTKAEKTSTDKDKDKDKKKEYAIGDKVKVENLTFQVNDVSEETELTMEYMDSLTTKGKFVIVDLEVFNNDKESRIIDTEMFRILDDDGTEFSPDSEADMYINDNDIGFFLEEINPKLSESGKIAFELPADTKDYVLQVSSGFGFSGGKYEEIDVSK